MLVQKGQANAQSLESQRSKDVPCQAPLGDVNDNQDPWTNLVDEGMMLRRSVLTTI